MSIATNNDDGMGKLTNSDASTVVSCRDVSKSFASANGKVLALDKVSLDVNSQELIAIRGKSGCGKSTLMLTLGGLQKPDHGTVTIGGQSIYDLNAEQRAKFRGQHIGYVFQQFHLIPYLNVVENVLSATLGQRQQQGRSQETAEALVERIGLSKRASHRPDQLSIGECQRVAIARALMNRPKVILADEPTGNLDAENTHTVLKCLRDIANDGTAVVIVTHDPLCDSVADRVIKMSEHQIV